MLNYIDELLVRVDSDVDLFLLNVYVDFCLSHVIDERVCENRYEYHHIIPRCVGSDIQKDKNNIILLTYEDHITAHIMLHEAYKKYSKFAYPVLLMSDDVEIKTSEFVKMCWAQFKKSDKYNSWRKKHSDYTKLYNSENKEYLRQINIDRFKDINTRLEYSNRSIEWHSNKTNKALHKNAILKSMTADVRVKISNNTKSLFENDEYRRKHIERTTVSNRDINKRKDASDKLIMLWKDIDYVERVNRGRKNGKVRDSESQANKLKKMWADPVIKAKWLDARRKKKDETN